MLHRRRIGHHHRGAVAPRDRIGPLLFGSAGAGGAHISLSTVSQRRKSIACLRDRSIGESDLSDRRAGQGCRRSDILGRRGRRKSLAFHARPQRGLDTWGKPGRGGRPGTSPGNIPEYLLRINNAGGPPGTKTPVHTHPGSETFMCCRGSSAKRHRTA